MSRSIFYAFSCVLAFSAWLVRRNSKRKALWTISIVLLVNCRLKFCYSFLFLSLTEILDTFDFLCLCIFSLTDLFLCASETKKNNKKERLYFSDENEWSNFIETPGWSWWFLWISSALIGLKTILTCRTLYKNLRKWADIHVPSLPPYQRVTVDKQGMFH